MWLCNICLHVARKARKLTLNFPVGLFLFSSFQPHDIHGSVKVKWWKWAHHQCSANHPCIATCKGKWFDPSTSSPVLCNYSSSGVEVLLGYSQNHSGGTSSSFTRGADKVWLCVGLSCRNVLLCGACERSPRALVSVPDDEVMLGLWSLLGHWQKFALSLSSLWTHIFLRLCCGVLYLPLELVRMSSWFEKLLGRDIKTAWLQVCFFRK